MCVSNALQTSVDDRVLFVRKGSFGNCGILALDFLFVLFVVVVCFVDLLFG